MILQIKRGTTVIAETANFSYTPALQEVRQITCEIVTVEKLEFVPYNSKAETTYDTITYNGSTFILFNAPSGEHRNEAGKYKYSLVFYGKEILLRNLAFLDVVSGSVSSSINQTRYTHGGIFSFFGDHNQLGQRIIANVDTYNASLSSAFTGIGTWTITFDIEGDVLENTISIADGTNLFDALKYFYDTFNLNYYFTTTANGGSIFVTDKKRGVIDWTFKQGDGNGAVSLSSSIDTSTPIVTRIIPQGGSRNMPPDYKKSSLPVDNTRYCPFILLPDVNGNIRYYLDSEYGLKHYGVRGRTIANDFSGIYPTIRGKVLGDLYPGGLPAYDTYLSNGNPDPQSGVVSGTGVSLSTQIDKIIGSSVIKSENDSTFSIYVTSPGFNLGYKVYTEGASGGSINDTYKPSFNSQGNLDYVSFRTGGMDGPSSKTLYTVARYYDQMLNVVGKTTGSFYAKLINHTATDYSSADVSFNLRLSINGNGAGASETITVKYTTENIPLSFDGQTLNGIYTGASGSVFAYIDIEASCPQAQTNEIEVRIYENTASGTINFNNISGIQNDKYYFKYGTASNAIISMRSGLYSGTEFEIDKNGVIPLHGVVDLARGETEEDAAMFQKGARYKYICRRTEADGTKYPFASTDNSEALAAGSDFVLLNLIMPETYVIMAENTLLRASQDYLSRYDHANKTVSVNISSGFVAEHPAVFDSFDIGNVMRVRDDAIGIHDIASDGTLSDMELQIQGLEIKYTESSIFPSYSCTVARMKSLSFYERLAKENQTYNSIQTTNISAGSGSGNANNIFSDGLINELIQAWTEFGSFFEFDKAKNAIRAKYALYTNDWLSALGAQSGSSGGGTGGGVVKSIFRFADLGKTFDDNNNDTFTAYTINEIWKLAKDGGGIKTLTVTGAGNAITNLTLSADGKTITATKDLEFVKKGEIDLTKYVTLDTAQEISGAKTFLADLNPKTTNVTSIGTSALRWKNIFASVMDAVTLNATNVYASAILQVGDVQIKYDTTAKAIYFEHKDGTTPIGIYSLGWISAKGVQTGGGSGGGGLITNLYRYADLGGEFDDNNNDTFTAYTINKIWEAVQAGMGIKTLTVTGSGNAITDMTLSADGRTITATKGTSFASADAFNTLNSKVNDFLTGTDTDNIINKWKELETFLSGMAETDNLATILATKADKTITISAGTGLTGGGDLSANRSFALATSGAKAGTYTKVTVDVYGRVTAGTTLVEADIPNLSWSKITGKPTTLAGYGITDAYTKAETDGKYVTISTDQDINGIKRFTKGLKLGSAASTVISESTTAFDLRVSLGSTTSSILRWNGTTYGNLVISSTGGVMYFRPNGDGNDANQMALNTAGNLSLKGILAANFIQIGDGVIKYDTTAKAIYFEHKDGTTVMGVYSKGWMSALGAQSGSGGGASTTLAGLLDVTITTPANGQALIYDGSKWVNKTIQQGLDTTAMWAALATSDSSKVIDISHIPNLPWSKITSGKPTTLAGYGITDAYTKAEADGRYVTALGTSGNNLTWTKNGTVNNITVPYATKSGSSDWLNTNTKLTYGASGLNYFNFNGTAGTTANANVTPVAGWHHILRMNHNNASGYFADIAVPMNTVDGIYWRQIRGGTNYGWYKLLDSNNYDSTLGSVYVKKTGDTMTGLLTLKTGSSHTGIKCGDSYMSAINGSVIFQNNVGGIRFSTIDNWDWNVWAGLKYVHSSKTVYLGLADGTIFTTNTAQTGGTVSMVNCKVQADYYLARNTTLCTNLNANYLEGYTNMGFIHSNFSAQTGGTAYASGDTHRMKVAEIAINTHYSSYVLLLSHEFWGHQHYSALLLHIAVTNNDNSGNKNPRCAVHVMSRTGNSGSINPVYYKVENNKAYIYIEVYGGNSYGNWNTTVLQARDSITVNNANSRGNLKLTFEFNQPTANMVAANYDNYINAMGFMDGSNQNTFVRKAGDTMTGTLTITSSLALQARVSAGTWAYFRLYNGSQYWDLATQSTRNNNFEIRYQGADAVRWDFKPDGALVPSKATLCTNLNADMIDGLHLSGLDSRYVNVTGDTMTGVLKSTYSSSTYINSVSNAVLTVNHRGYGGIWCAPTKSGRVVMSTYPSDNDNVYLGYASAAQISAGTNSFNRSTYWAATTGIWTADGYAKKGSSDSYVLLGGGGHKALSTMQSEYDARYVNITGDTMTSSLRLSSGYVYLTSGWFQNDQAGVGLYNGNQDARWYANGGWWIADKPIQGPYFKSTIGTGTAPYQCSSTTLNTNLNADLLDGYHSSAFRMGYYGGRAKYRLAPWGGSTDTSWRWVVRYVNTGGGTYQACTVIGTIWLTTGNHSQAQVVDIPFQAMFYAYGGTANSMLNQSYLHLPQYCNWDLIRIVRYANNSWELQIRQPFDWSLISTEYTVINSGGTVTAGQFTSSGIHSSTIANSYNLNKTMLSNQYVNRADHADRLTTARNFYINSYDNYRAGAATSFNGTSDVTLKLPNSIRCNDWFRSIGNTGWYNESYGGGIYMYDSSYVRVYNNKHFRVNGLISCGEHQDDTYGYYNCTRGNSTSIAYSCYAMVMVGTRTFGLGYRNTDIVLGSCTTSRTINPWVYIDGGRLQMQGNIYATGAMTAKSSGSDIRLKKDIQSYNAMSIINRFRSVKYHWNAIAKANSEVYNNDYDQYGLIAQDLLAGGYKQWVKDVFKDYYTIEYERLIPVVWKGLQEVDSEVDKLKREVATLKNRIAILEGRKSLSA